MATVKSCSLRCTYYIHVHYVFFFCVCVITLLFMQYGLLTFKPFEIRCFHCRFSGKIIVQRVDVCDILIRLRAAVKSRSCSIFKTYHMHLSQFRFKFFMCYIYTFIRTLTTILAENIEYDLSIKTNIALNVITIITRQDTDTVSYAPVILMGSADEY